MTAPEGGLNRLMGLSYAVARHAKHGQPIEGQYQTGAEIYRRVPGVRPAAAELPTAVGARTSWPPEALVPDPATQLRSTGRVLEWLTMSLPDQRLEDAHLVSAVEYLANLLGRRALPGHSGTGAFNAGNRRRSTSYSSLYPHQPRSMDG